VSSLASSCPTRHAACSGPGHGVKGGQAAPGVFEMTWAPDGRAAFSYGPEQQVGELQVIWQRIGTQDIFREP